MRNFHKPSYGSLTQLHGYKDSVRWRLTELGVEVEGSGLERTPGDPITVTRIWETYHAEINQEVRAIQEFRNQSKLP